MLWPFFQALMPFASSPTFGFVYRSTVATFPQAFLLLGPILQNFFICNSHVDPKIAKVLIPGKINLIRARKLEAHLSEAPFKHVCLS